MNSFQQHRRQFLAWAGQGMVLLSATTLTACGGSGDDGDGGDSVDGAGGGDGESFGGNGAPAGGSPGAAVGPQQRVATLDSVRNMVASLGSGSAHFDSAALASAMQSLPALERVGISSRMGNVWARFTDGQMLVVPNNLEPGTASGASAHTAPQAARPARAQALAQRERSLAGDGGLDLPSLLVAQQYRQLDMFGEVPMSSSPEAAHLCQNFVSAETLPRLRKMAVGRGFILPAIQTGEPPDEGIDNGVLGLSRLSGDGVFFITACAAQAGNDDSPRTLICTGTAATEANLARHEASLNAGLLSYAVGMRGFSGAWEPFACLAIGPEFASLNWSFPTESIGIFNLTGGASLSDWIVPLNRAGLRHILGWEQAVSWQRMLAFADDLVQLSLATNNLDGTNVRQAPEPRLRAYGVGETLGHLIKRGVAAGPNGGNAALYLQASTPALYANTLLPTIDYALIREGRMEFELVGQFGGRADTADVSARIALAQSAGEPFAEGLLSRAADAPLQGSDKLRDPQWQGDLLQTLIDVEQLARGGYVQVFNGGRCSNVVPITHWEIPLRAVTTIDELTLSITVTIHLRADVHGWRLDPEAQPRNGAFQLGLESSVHSHADFTASGTISRNDALTRTTTTISWSGDGSIGNSIGNVVVTLGGLLLWDSRRLSSVTLGVNGGGAHRQRTVMEQFDINGTLLRRTDETVDVPVALSAAGPGQQGLLELNFDDVWGLQAGEFDMLPVDDHILPAPPQRVRRSRISWPAVTPDFPPRKDYGGT